MDAARWVIEALFIGALAALVVIYAFQTRVVYPKWMLHALDKPWILLLALIVCGFLYPYSPRISALAIILVLALWLDVVLFANNFINSHKNDADFRLIEPAKAAQPNMEVWPYDEPLEQREFENNGPSLASIAIAEPNYPTFFGLDVPQPGPAPF